MNRAFATLMALFWVGFPVMSHGATPWRTTNFQVFSGTPGPQATSHIIYGIGPDQSMDICAGSDAAACDGILNSLFTEPCKN